ncbi:hypothetical protein Tcan_13503 [Toxocara canis]|uniref:Uncharacterized protein n=1 Tax=Toxocara canis TaxID=6265 RepID=A0A0B2VPE2_TOXCA|nr:hypothetical protein Tcan_13503 [Toxocara canis]
MTNGYRHSASEATKNNSIVDTYGVLNNWCDLSNWSDRMTLHTPSKVLALYAQRDRMTLYNGYTVAGSTGKRLPATLI